MALTKPILNNVAAFDASNSQAFTFNVVGGSQVVGNTLTIKDNTTLSIVYNNTQTSFKLQHIVPAGTLSNGKYYQAYVTTVDAQGNVSVQSNTIQFNCYTQPTFQFTNVSENTVIDNVNCGSKEDLPIAIELCEKYDIATKITAALKGDKE